jgi:hypothetical protein
MPDQPGPGQSVSIKVVLTMEAGVRWSASSGQIADPNAATTSYTCSGTEATAKVSVQVIQSNPSCADTPFDHLSFTIDCSQSTDAQIDGAVAEATFEASADVQAAP